MDDEPEYGIYQGVRHKLRKVGERVMFYNPKSPGHENNYRVGVVRDATLREYDGDSDHYILQSIHLDGEGFGNISVSSNYLHDPPPENLTLTEIESTSMQTPLDRFHYALQNLVAQKAATEARAKRPPPDQMALGVMGERVIYKPAGPHTDQSWHGVHGMVTDPVGYAYGNHIGVVLDNAQRVSGNIVHFVQEHPLPTFTNAEDVDAWLAS